MISRAAILLVVFSALTAFAQAPDLRQGREIWRGQIDGRELRLVQIPRKPTALIPLRFVLEEIGRGSHQSSGTHSCAQCAGGADVTPASGTALLDRFTHAEFHATSGSEALLSYAPARVKLHFWGDNQVEVRETFRSPGEYELRFASDENTAPVIQAAINVRPVQYLNFGEEFGLFVLGCLLLGAVFLAIIIYLHRRMPPNRTNASRGAEPTHSLT